jgi:hypothetical protein
MSPSQSLLLHDEGFTAAGRDSDCVSPLYMTVVGDGEATVNRLIDGHNFQNIGSCSRVMRRMVVPPKCFGS